MLMQFVRCLTAPSFPLNMRVPFAALRRRVQGQDTSNHQGSDEPEEPNYPRCCICLDDRPANKGLSCPSGHFLCDECLGDYLTSRVSNVSTIRTDGLKLPCPEPGCGLPSFAPLTVIASHLPPAAIGVILKSVDDSIPLLGGKEQLPNNDVQPAPQGGPQDDIQRYRLNVVNDILTIRKPCECQGAFLDFDGCCAIYCDICPRERRAFCAICLALCGSDAHPHVREQHGDRVFISEQEFREHHNRRRQDLLIRYFRDLDGSVDREALMNALHQDLDDLGMNVEEFRAPLVLGAPPPIIQPPQPPKNVVQPAPQANLQDDIQCYRLYVVDDILTMKTPCECQRPFLDFDGCFPIYCDICPRSRGVFCPLCLVLCDSEAHMEELHEGMLYMSEQEFQEHHNRRRQGLLLGYFCDLDANVDREALLNALHQDLADLGMNVDEIRDVLRLNALLAIIQPPEPPFQPLDPPQPAIQPVAPRILPFMRRNHLCKSILIVVFSLIILALRVWCFLSHQTIPMRILPLAHPQQPPPSDPTCPLAHPQQPSPSNPTCPQASR